MFRKFVNRKSELDFLNKKAKEKGLQVIIIYGRRRVGKTELIKEFIKNKEAIYFLADKRGTNKNLERFADILQEYYDLPPLRMDTFEETFKLITSRTGGKRFVVIIDEFSYLIERDPALISVFQMIIDEILKEMNLFLILCGSSMSMMEKGVLSFKSPLYGRRTGQIKLKSMNLKALKEFFPRYSIGELIETYGILGGIPAYLILFDPTKNIFDNIKETFFIKEHIFYEEPEMILKEELREPRVYFNILDAMAHGKTKLTEIANKAGINAKDSSAYINSLIRLDMVEKDYPITEKKPRTKKALYFIKDDFFIFWFRFILDNKEKIEREKTSLLLKGIKEELSAHVSKCFEKVCVEFLWAKKTVNFTKIGRWWGVYRDRDLDERKSLEIDIVALNEETKEILFAECKWWVKRVGKDIAEELLAKAEYVDWNKKKRKEYFALFSKSGFKKSCQEFCRERGILLFDLKDIEELFWNEII